MEGFSTKQKGDVAEYRVITECLLRGLSVLKPLGDRLPYDLALDRNGSLIRIQVKMAWFDGPSKCYKADIRRSQTNRAVYKHSKYVDSDFEFFVAWLPKTDVFYIFPVGVACSYRSGITMVEDYKRQREPRSAAYRNRWDLLVGAIEGSPQSVAIDGTGQLIDSLPQD